MTKNCAPTLPSKPFEPFPPLPGPCSLSQCDWLADRESADYRLSSPARVISGGAEQPRSQACQGPSEEDQGGATELHHQLHRSPSALGHKVDQPPITPPSPQKVPWREGKQGAQSEKGSFSLDWEHVFLFFKAKAMTEIYGLIFHFKK